MPRIKELTDFEKSKIVSLKENRVGMRKISRQIERLLCVVQNFLKSPSEYGTMKRSGHKRHLDGRIERQIMRNASTSTMSLARLRCLAGVNVSRFTIWRTLKRA